MPKHRGPVAAGGTHKGKWLERITGGGSGFRIFVERPQHPPHPPRPHPLKRAGAGRAQGAPSRPSRATRQPGLGPTSRRHPTGIPKGRGRGDEARGGKSDRATPLPSGLSDDDSAGPSQSRPSKWRSPLLGLGVSSEARNGKLPPRGLPVRAHRTALRCYPSARPAALDGRAVAAGPESRCSASPTPETPWRWGAS